MTTIDDRNDTIFVEGVPHLVKFTAASPWFGDQLQQIHLSAEVQWPTSKAGATDSVDHTLNYVTIYESLVQRLEESSTISDLLETCARRLQLDLKHSTSGKIVLTASKLLALADAALRVELKFPQATSDKSWIQNIELQHLKVYCIVGVGEVERVQRQPLIINIRMNTVDESRVTKSLSTLLHDDNYLSWAHAIVKMIDDGQFLTLEAVAHNVARRVLVDLRIQCRLAIRITKPAIFSACDGPGVCITRVPGDFADG